VRISIFAKSYQILIKSILFMATKAYCVKCKEKNREMKDEKEVTIKGKGGTTRRAAQGICPVCGTKMFRFLPSKKK